MVTSIPTIHDESKRGLGLVYWLVVLAILKSISQWEGLSHILWKIKTMFETTNQYIHTYPNVSAFIFPPYKYHH